MRVFKRLFMPFDELEDRLGPAGAGSVARSVAESPELVRGGEAELAWTTDAARTDAVRLKPHK
jgi:hypothetical protein